MSSDRAILGNEIIHKHWSPQMKMIPQYILDTVVCKLISNTGFTAVLFSVCKL